MERRNERGVQEEGLRPQTPSFGDSRFVGAGVEVTGCRTSWLLLGAWVLNPEGFSKSRVGSPVQGPGSRHWQKLISRQVRTLAE